MTDVLPQTQFEPLLRPDEVAAIMNCPESTLRSFRAAKTGPRFIRLGYKVVRYRRQDIEDYIAACTK